MAARLYPHTLRDDEFGTDLKEARIVTEKTTGANGDEPEAELSPETLSDLEPDDAVNAPRGGSPRETYYVTCSCTAGPC